MQLQIITPEKTLFSADADMVVIPGTEGDFGVLPGHAPFISTIRPGVITIDSSDGQKYKIAIFGGIAEVVPERCTVLAETAIESTSLTADYLNARIEIARNLATAGNDATDEGEKHTAYNDMLKLLLGETIFE